MPEPSARPALTVVLEAVLLVIAGLVVVWAHDGAAERGAALDLLAGLSNAVLVASLAFAAAVSLASLVSTALRSGLLQVHRAGVAFVWAARKVPLAVQFLLWFGLLSLAPAHVLKLGGAVYVSDQALYLPQIVWNARGAAALAAITAAALLGVAFTFWAQQRVRQSRTAPMPGWGLIIFLSGTGMTLMVSGNPSALDLPHGQGVGFGGGLAVPTPFMALWAAMALSGAAAIGAIFAEAEGTADAPPRTDPFFRSVVGQYLTLLAGACVAFIIGWPAPGPWTGSTVAGLSLAVSACLALNLAVCALRGAWNARSGVPLGGRRRNPERA